MKKCIIKITMRNIFGFTEEVEIGSDRYNELRRVDELYKSNEALCKEITSLRNTVRVLSQNIVSASVDDVNFIHELENQITELKQQLAEKDKEIERLNNLLADADDELEEIEKSLYGKNVNGLTKNTMNLLKKISKTNDTKSVER